MHAKKFSPKRFAKKAVITLIALAIPTATFFGGATVAEYRDSGVWGLPFTQPAVDVTNPTDLRPFWWVWNKVKQVHVDGGKVSDTDLMQGAIGGIVHALHDPYSEYFTAQDAQEFTGALASSLTGIGAEVGQKDDKIVVISPLRGSPAEAAGLQPQDFILKINNELTTQMTLQEAVNKIRGPEGTQVTLTIIRDGETEPLSITITRQSIHIDSVTSTLRDDGVGILTIATFAENTDTEFRTQFQGLLNQHAKGIVIDLRFDGGGFLEKAMSIASTLMEKDTVVVRIRERNKPEQVLKTTGDVVNTQIPVAVLINEGSASASEILAGALQDNHRATIVGKKSFGKGTVQELLPVFGDGALLKLTIAKWFTPSGHDVTADKITPDTEVGITREDVAAKQDSQMEKAAGVVLHSL